MSAWSKATAKAARQRKPTTDLVMRARLLSGKFHIPADDAMTVAVCGAEPMDVGASHFALSGDRKSFEKMRPEQICKRCLRAEAKKKGKA